MDLTPYLVAHWKMNDNAASTVVLDSSGNGYNGTAQQNTSALYTTGKINGALTFNGTRDYINTNDTFQSTFRDSFSVNLWCKATDGITGVYQNLFNADRVAPEHFVELGIRATGKFHSLYKVSGALRYAEEDNPSFIDGENDWKMLTMVATKISATTGNIAIYANGVLRKQGTTGNIIFANYTNPYNPYIGVYNRAGDTRVEWFEDSLDNVMIFNKALSQEEITYLYNFGYGTEDLSSGNNTLTIPLIMQLME
jgi:hypothetical protein